MGPDAMIELGRRRWLSLALATAACRGGSPRSPAHARAGAPEPLGDPHSAARPHEVRVRHVGFRWSVAPAARVLSGTATYGLERFDPEAPLVLDTRGLRIEAVEVGHSPSAGHRTLARVEPRDGWRAASHRSSASDPILGSALEVELPPGIDLVRIRYRTGPDSTGLQWLEPEQTADRRHPFLYSQSQAIHARSWFPCQDTPAVRITYDAEIEAPAALQPLMAARRVAPGRFEMPEPIPAYLVALAVGHVSFQETGPRSGVWAEPSVLERASHELADVERMMDTAEALYGPYRWERYDVLFLPPAFPFGGMENPRLTFATPTILAGDRSLVSLIAHELAHSWSGNLVTNATWDHLWLNEGFTVYIERRIVEALFGRERAEMEALLGRQDLEREIAAVDDADERLRVDLAGRDPDDGLSDVAYEKGALLLRALEETYGRETFDPLLRRWFDDHAFTSVRTSEFEQWFRANLLDIATPLPGRRAPDLAAWIDRPALPPDAPKAQSDAFARVDDVAAGWVGGELSADSLPGREWTAHQWLHFLRALPPRVGSERLADLDAVFGLTGSGNAEILAQWLDLSVHAGYRAVDDRLEQFLRTVGRRKFLEPLYQALLDADRRDEALRIYGVARPGYHAITQRTLDGLLASGRPT
jgi:leukotriene-A4 hydrolase